MLFDPLTQTLFVAQQNVLKAYGISFGDSSNCYGNLVESFCQTCSSSNDPRACDTCWSGFVYNSSQKSCALDCPSGQFAGTNLTGRKFCQSCSSMTDCSECVLPETDILPVCTKCRGDSVYLSEFRACQLICPDRYYKTPDLYCKPNPIGCLWAYQQFLDEKVKCQTPDPGYILVNFTDVLKCSEVIASCDICQSFNIDNRLFDKCTKCLGNTILNVDGTCTDVCPKLHYIDPSQLCRPNPENCKTVNAATGVCIEALEGYHLVNGVPQKCTDSIPICQMCTSAVVDSVIKVTCQKCDSSTQLRNNVCTRVCQESEYVDDKNQCKPKPDNCIEVHQSGICTLAKEGYYLRNGSVISCESVYPFCSRCTATTDRDNLTTVRCNACVGTMKFDLVSIKCVGNCPSNTYLSIFDDCRLKATGCKSADLYGKCLEADEGYYLTLDTQTQIKKCSDKYRGCFSCRIRESQTDIETCDVCYGGAIFSAATTQCTKQCAERQWLSSAMSCVDNPQNCQEIEYNKTSDGKLLDSVTCIKATDGYFVNFIRGRRVESCSDIYLYGFGIRGCYKCTSGLDNFGNLFVNCQICSSSSGE